MKGERILFVILALTVLLLVSAELGVAHGETVGVQTGNSFTYEVLSASSLSEVSGADTFTVNVTNVVGTIVDYTLTLHYPNGTTSTNQDSDDVSDGNGQGSSWLLIAANLQVGELLFPGAPLRINDTVTLNGRPTNEVSATNVYVNNVGQNVYVTGDIFCDQATGAAVNVTLSMTSEQSGWSESFSYALLSSNVILVPEFSTVALAVTMIMLTGCATVIARAFRRPMIPSKHQH